jgi:hypothetical protein
MCRGNIIAPQLLPDEGSTVEQHVARVFSILKGFYRIPVEHNLNPKVFLLLAAVGTVVHVLYYLPWFKTYAMELSFLTFLRALALVGPLYIFLRGRRIAALLNLSFLGGWALSTTWHVCYFVYL